MSEEQEKLPRAYREGVAEFYGREFLVTPDVLIPRPETEMMVDAVLKLCGKAILPGVRAESRLLPWKPRILDVGTGSGVVGITLKLEIPEAEVVLADVSSAALGVALRNIERFGVEVETRKSDLLRGVETKFDVIVANLPYVDRNWEWLDKEALDFEPELALYAEDGGVKLIFRLIEEIVEKETLVSGGFLVLEADPSQHEKIREKAESLRFKFEETRGFSLVFSR